MKAQVLHKYDPEMKEKVWVTGEELPNPKIEKASDVIVKIGAAGVCRTDLHIIEGVWKHIQDPDGKLLPCVMGHENAGWIEDVGKDVTEFKKGDPVILHPLISGTDGTCLDCRRGNDMHAAAGAFPGLSIKEGGYSELLKTSVRNLIKLPKVCIFSLVSVVFRVFCIFQKSGWAARPTPLASQVPQTCRKRRKRRKIMKKC